MTLRRAARPKTKSQYSVDQFYAGIDPQARCECRCRAADHIVTFRRTTAVSIRCEGCGKCKGWYDGWQKAAGS